MPPNSPLPRKRGRPPKDNRQFNIRMLPQTHDALLRAASQAGYANLGDWLSHIVQQNVWPQKEKKPRLTHKKAFARDVAEATRLLNCLFESFDKDTKVADDQEILRSLGYLNSVHDKLFHFLRGESLPV